MKAEYLNPFIHATKNVLSVMAKLNVQAKKPYLKDNNHTFGEVTGIIGMASDDVEGSMVISFNKGCILKIVSTMLMEPEKQEIDEDIVDAVGELTNMICGGAKAELSKLGLNFNLATPAMITGKGVEIFYKSEMPTIVIPFTSDSGEFVLEANLGDR